MGILVFISVLLVAACGLIYELVAGTLASYLVGDSVFQFSTIIGRYLFPMGIGSALSRYINRGLANRFVWIERLLCFTGGSSYAFIRLDQRRRRALEHFPFCESAFRHARSARCLSCCLVRIGRGNRASEANHRHRRRQYLRRRDYICPRHSLPASRPHPLQG